MMKDLVLAINTALGKCTVCLFKEEQVVHCEYYENSDHSKNIGPMLNRALKIASGNIDQVLVITGPGSFTGIRCGISAALGVAAGLGTKINGMSCFDAIAAEYSHIQDDKLIAIDTKQQNAFYCKKISLASEKIDSAVIMKREEVINTAKDLVLLSNDKDLITNCILCKNKYYIRDINLSVFTKTSNKNYANIYPIYLQQPYKS